MSRTPVGRRGIRSSTLVRRKVTQLARLWVVIGLCCGALAVVGCERTEEHAAAFAQTPDEAGRGRRARITGEGIRVAPEARPRRSTREREGHEL